MIMNNKILAEVIVPLLNTSYELYIPIKLIENSLRELSNGYYPNKENSIIIDQNSGNVYDINITVKESKIMNGSKLILI